MSVESGPSPATASRRHQALGASRLRILRLALLVPHHWRSSPSQRPVGLYLTAELQPCSSALLFRASRSFVGSSPKRATALKYFCSTQAGTSVPAFFLFLQVLNSAIVPANDRRRSAGFP